MSETVRQVSTDDASRRMRFIWKGEPGHPFPFDATGVAWVLGSTLTLVLVPIAYFLLGRLNDWPWTYLVFPPLLTKAVLCVPLGAGAAILLTRRLGKSINPLTPFRHHLGTLANELATPRPDAATPPEAISVRPDLFIEDRDPDRHRRRVTVPATLLAHPDPEGEPT